MRWLTLMRTSLAAKFLVGAAVVLAAAMVLLATLQYMNQQRSIAREIEVRGKGQAQVLAIAAIQPILNYDSSTLEKMLKAAVEDEIVASVRIDNKDGKQVAAAKKPKLQGKAHEFKVPIPGEGGVVLGSLMLEIDDAPFVKLLQENLKRLLGMLGLTTVVLFVVIYFLFATLVGKRLKSLAQTMTAMAEQGELSTRLDHYGGDEVGEVATAFTTYTTKMRSLVGNIREATDRLQQASEQLLAGSRETSQAMASLDATTEQIVQAIDTMSASSEGVSQRSAQAAQAAAQADEAGHRAHGVVDHFVNSIRLMANEVRDSADVIKKLETDASNIGSILDVIRDIADQTNLLALNAAIEAARAGEQGRGFAVVADEVRKLAQRTQEATAEIQSMIERLQRAAESAVTVIGSGRQKAESSVEEADGAGATLEGIAQSIAVIDEMNAHIASAVHEQTGMAQRIKDLISSVSELTRCASNDAYAISKRAESIGDISADLRRGIGAFHSQD